ncbi:MAG TPA: Hpt domain-containing protein [Pseudobdellovibrionaceae bacterium]|jgi:HPt (histidine-containing phosphotransfer) domain-containing protein
MKSIKTEIDIDADIIEMVPDFCQARNADFENIAQYLKTKNFTAIAEISHTIKGIAKPYGFPTLEKLCRELELAAKAKDENKCLHVFHQIKEYFIPFM